MKQCTGCGKYDNEPLGLNKNGEPYLACCPDSNYVEVKNRVKLYTEEQVKKAIHRSRFYQENLMPNYLIIELIDSIELPSDEEIEEESQNKTRVDFGYHLRITWVEGAKWMKEQILNQNK